MKNVRTYANENKKKIAIVTWVSETTNYGTILQAYALQEFLRDVGADVKHCNYIPDGSDVIWPSSTRLKFRYLFRKMKTRGINRNSKSRFTSENMYSCKKFINKNILLTNRCINRDEAKDCLCKFDYVVCGSDQIWNIARKKNPVYFLDFDIDFKKIAYAPSIPVRKINKTEKKWLRRVLSDFVALSVREKYSKKLLEKIVGKSVEDVLDPVFLINKNQWNNISAKVNELKNKKYIYCYFLGDNLKYKKLVKHISEILGVSCVCIQTPRSLECNEKTIQMIGPESFIELIRNAYFVLTDSYHAMLFSVIFKKNFYVVKRFLENTREYQNLRCIDFLNKVDLQDRFISSRFKLQEIHSINYDSVKKKIDKEKEKSQLFLMKHLEVLNGKIRRKI